MYVCNSKELGCYAIPIDTSKVKFKLISYKSLLKIIPLRLTTSRITLRCLSLTIKGCVRLCVCVCLSHHFASPELNI